MQEKKDDTRYAAAVSFVPETDPVVLQGLRPYSEVLEL